MERETHRILDVNLNERRGELSRVAGLGDLIGGLGLGLRLIQRESKEPQTIFSLGPLSGLFPFASKYSILYYDKGTLKRESYGSGRLAFVMRFAQIDAVIIHGTSPRPVLVSAKAASGDVDLKVDFFDDDESGDLGFVRDGLPGRTAILSFTNSASFVDDYFLFDAEVGQSLYLNNLRRLRISGDRSVQIAKETEYRTLYREILGRGSELEVTYGQSRSCGVCPAACESSKELEERPDLILSHCLVTCGFARRIYESESLVFACLNSLGLDYKHEDLEAVATRVGRLRQSFE